MATKHPPGSASSSVHRRRDQRATGAVFGWLQRGRSGAVQSYRVLLASWPVRGFNSVGAGHLSAILVYNGLVALVPTTLLVVSVAGLVLRRDAALTTFIRAVDWALPSADARQALEAALAARCKSGWFALASLGGFVWIGSGFAGALNHCVNRFYGVPDGTFIATRRRGLAVLAAFVALFTAVTVAATLPALFIQRDVGPYFRTWVLAGARGQIASYALAYGAAALAFLLIYRLTPNAGQRLREVWPGALVAGGLFVVLGQAFPLYLRLIGGVNRYGAAFGLLTLLLAWFAVLAHILLFGCYVNVTYRRRRGSWPLRRVVTSARPASHPRNGPWGGRSPAWKGRG
ncbi:MAG: YihY/virulence factor BrkB family protein [Acidimicrobiales bacterium]